ncbi:MAG: hypothetical protein CMQ34_03555 [Gammaproteobacteria bacterium]|nr:hypothetical protein [Gammaproteobacteria bacterium]|tara:strand:+ start:699 stop:1310 length:612 start_codon:yes stop_codon:yes gene_type:complete
MQADSHNLTLADIGTLAQYQQRRHDIRRAMIAHKQNRRVALGPHVTLHFEDWHTMKYQVQEMMRAENLHDEQDIAQELAAYNPLIPDGNNLKCTLMIELSDPGQRQQALRKLVGLEHSIDLQIGNNAPVNAIADEDLIRTTTDKTSAVHFLRFQFTAEMIAAACAGAHWTLASRHPAYAYQVTPLPDNIVNALCRDFTAAPGH